MNRSYSENEGNFLITQETRAAVSAVVKNPDTLFVCLQTQRIQRTQIIAHLLLRLFSLIL